MVILLGVGVCFYIGVETHSDVSLRCVCQIPNHERNLRYPIEFEKSRIQVHFPCKLPGSFSNFFWSGRRRPNGPQPGRIVAREWARTAEIRPYVALGAFCVMPNHFHCNVIIDWQGTTRPNDKTVETPVETHGYVSLRKSYKNMFGPQSHNIAAIVRGFKGACTKQIHQAGHEYFKWQSNYHDHVIRMQDYERIEDYILNNPARWRDDVFFGEE